MCNNVMLVAEKLYNKKKMGEVKSCNAKPHDGFIHDFHSKVISYEDRVLCSACGMQANIRKHHQCMKLNALGKKSSTSSIQCSLCTLWKHNSDL